MLAISSFKRLLSQMAWFGLGLSLSLSASAYQPAWIDRLDFLSSEASALVMDTRHYPVFEYPIIQPADLMNLRIFDGNAVIKIFEYGNLINSESAEHTLSNQALKSIRPAVAFGIRRVFDRYNTLDPRWPSTIGENDAGFLNIHATRDAQDRVNGIVMALDIEDLKSLLKRKNGYDLYPVVVMNWKQATDYYDKEPDFIIAYTFRASSEIRNGQVFTNKHINPVPHYARASSLGASRYGALFLSMWVDTTYLADSTTPLASWITNTSYDAQPPINLP